MSLQIQDKKEMAKATVNCQHELSVIEQVVMQGDLSKLNPEQRVTYYRKVCESSGLNPYTRPFDYISLNGKLTLYAKKDATEQLRKLNGISITKLEARVVDDLYIVTATAKTKDGRTDESTGAVTIGRLTGDAKANAIMKAETKAKRRVTLSISGMGWTDETEIESIPHAKMVEVDLDNGEIKNFDVKSTAIPLVKEVTISFDQAEELIGILDACDSDYQANVLASIKKSHNCTTLYELPISLYDRLKSSSIKKKEEFEADQVMAKVLERSNVKRLDIVDKG